MTSAELLTRSIAYIHMHTHFLHKIEDAYYIALNIIIDNESRN